ncbi:MAG: hypothetical protein IJT51_06425 [Bacteroidales bacterium]|nr:hypothetical protein [Bacteroidales bacterium]
MKRIYFYLLAGIVFLTGCNQSKNVHYDVNPDKVLGNHYTAEDFGLWLLLDYDDEQYVLTVDEAIGRLPEEKEIFWAKEKGFMVPASDTAEFMQALRMGEIPLTKEGCKLIPCWLPIVSVKDDIYLLTFCYGDVAGKPIIDGTHVKKVSVEKSEFTGNYEVLMQFDMKTADSWQKFTAENVGRRIGMMLGTDRLLSTPQIMCEIAGGACSISGPTEEECYAIAKILQGEGSK